MRQAQAYFTTAARFLVLLYRQQRRAEKQEALQHYWDMRKEKYRPNKTAK
jgi:hypothetical protein